MPHRTSSRFTYVVMATIMAIMAVAIYWSGFHHSAVTPIASMFTGETGGCSHFFAYRFNPDKTLVLGVRFDVRKHPLGDEGQTFNIQDRKNSLVVEALQFPRGSKDRTFYCDDFGGHPEPVARWNAVAGTAEIVSQKSPPPAEFRNATHRVTVRLQNVVLEREGTTNRVTFGNVDVDDVWVGWWPG